MTCTEWNMGINFLTTAEVGAWVDHESRTVIIEEMCGGKYLLLDCKEICGVTNSVIEAMSFLRG